MNPCTCCKNDPDRCQYHPCNGCDADDDECEMCTALSEGFDCNVCEKRKE